MTPIEVKGARQALLDGVARLVDEFDGCPPGVVMRCYSRAVRQARRTGHPPGVLQLEVERRVRAMLAARYGPLAPRTAPTRPAPGGGRDRSATGAFR